MPPVDIRSACGEPCNWRAPPGEQERTCCIARISQRLFRSGDPSSVTLHDLIPLVVPGVMPSALKRSLYSGWNRRAARVADRIIVPSATTAADVERMLPEARGKVRVIPEAADDFLPIPGEPSWW